MIHGGKDCNRIIPIRIILSVSVRQRIENATTETRKNYTESTEVTEEKLISSQNESKGDMEEACESVV